MAHHPKVTLFVQCLVDTMYPEVAEAMVRIFEQAEISVNCPEEQTCCGQVAFNSGYFMEAQTAARHFIEVFEGCESIVCPSGSCVHMVRHHYPDLFKTDSEWHRRARAIGGRTFELSQYLIDVLDVTDLEASYEGIITFHDSCHGLRGLGIYDQPRRLISGVQGARFVEMRDSEKCCGFGGTFSVKYPEISTAIVDEKVNQIMESGADTVVGTDISCLMNIQGRLNRKKSSIKVIHLAQLLAAR